MNVHVPDGSRVRDLPVLMLPGTLCDGDLFAPLLDILAASPTARARFVVETLNGGNTVADVARRILADAPPRFALLGFSLGGIVALQIAMMAPERVKGLALLDSNARAVPDHLHLERRQEAAAGARDLGRHLRDRLWPLYVAPARLGDTALRKTIFGMASRGGGDALIMQTVIGLSRADQLPNLSTLAMPALVLAGEEDALCPAEMQYEIAARLPDAALRLVPGAGHFAPLERPEPVAAEIAAWLGRVEAVVGAPAARERQNIR